MDISHSHKTRTESGQILVQSKVCHWTGPVQTQPAFAQDSAEWEQNLFLKWLIQYPGWIK